jgi:hypothetical protein
MPHFGWYLQSAVCRRNSTRLLVKLRIFHFAMLINNTLFVSLTIMSKQLFPPQWQIDLLTSFVCEMRKGDVR